MNSPHASSGPFGQRRGPAKNGKGPRASSENQRMEGPCFAFPLQNHQQYHTHGSTALTAATYQSLPLFGSCIILTFRYNNNHYIPTYIILYYTISQYTISVYYTNLHLSYQSYQSLPPVLWIAVYLVSSQPPGIFPALALLLGIFFNGVWVVAILLG